jgi:GrpB-like predicted nucleotidyltransferase (UPF0157 family)
MIAAAMGARGRSVVLAAHSKEWHQWFAEEAVRLHDAIGEQAERCIAPLANLGYEYRGENGIPGRFYFVKGDPRTHHLHVSNGRSSAWGNHLAFRDHLRQNGDAAKEYDRLERRLAETFRDDKASYTEGKAPFIEAVLRRAG